MYLLTGATGYVGGRLLRRLERDGQSVRCICRRPETLAPRVQPSTQVVGGDFLDPASLESVFEGVETAFYLVHAMQAAKEFQRDERRAALNFAEAAAKANVKRIIYLGGLSQDYDLSPHMRSRRETGDILRSAGVPVIEFRASIVIGSGSASFEMIRALVERLPVMVTPRWVNTAAQPIAIEDVIEYLAAAAQSTIYQNRTFEIGAPDVTSYAGIMREYAAQRGLRRWIIRVPWLSLSLSSRWLTLITPVYARIGRRLIESVRNPSVVRDNSALAVFPIRPLPVARAIQRALANEDHVVAETRWSDAHSANPVPQESLPSCGKTLVDQREAWVAADPDDAFVPIRRIGGETGWYYANFLWRMRGLLDLLAGGVGMRRGRPDPETPFTGSTLDFWRVESYEPGRRLRLRAEMKVPGRAWLEFQATPEGNFTRLRQIATFEPNGAIGSMYWYALYPIHQVMFRGMLRRIAAQVTRQVPRFTRVRVAT